ncbi:hypothetical protein AB0K15_40860 [Amycolatopsis sp. NPDC049253]
MWTVAATDAGVARAAQSNPQAVHSTGRKPSFRAATKELAENTP